MRMFEDEHAILLLLHKDEKALLAIAKQTEAGYVFTVHNEAIVPGNCQMNPDSWLIGDDAHTGEPYIWYIGGHDSEHFACSLAQDTEGIWRVVSGSFGNQAVNDSNPIAFETVNRGTALRIYSESYFDAVYIPLTIDLTLAGYDGHVTKAACEEAMLGKNGPMLIPSTMEPDALPQGEVIQFAKGKKYPVYAGPGTEYLRLGSGQKASVSTNDWIQVFGQGRAIGC